MSDINFEWDAFISHASEDKSSFVEPLVAELRKYGLKIWFDKFTLRVGSSLRESIDEGLAKSRFGVVVLSHAFFAKNWPKKELNGLFSRQVDGHDVVLPIWHDLTKEDLLEYSPLLSDIFAAKSSEGLVAVARSLVHVIRPEAFQLETSRLDGQNATARIRERLKDAHPELDCRVTFGPAELDPLSLVGVQRPSDVVVSRVQEATKIEVFAPNKAAYNSNPISFNLRMTKEAWEKFQDAQQKGELVEFGSEEILGLTSDFFASFGSEPHVSSTGVRKLVVGPSSEVMNRRLRFKLTFTAGEEAEEFPYVEFQMIRPGQEDIEIRSSAPPLPFQLTLTLNLAGGPSGMKVSYLHAGYEIRKIYKAHRAVRLFMNGGTLEMFDLEADQMLPRLQGARLMSHPNESDAYWEKFIEAAWEVVEALNDTLIWPARPTRDDSIHLQHLIQIVRTGEVSIPVETFTVTVSLPGIDIRTMLEQQGTVYFSQVAPPDFATVFGKTFDLGPYFIISKLREFEVIAVEDNPDCQVIRITPAEPLVFQFEKYCRPKPVTGGPNAA